MKGGEFLTLAVSFLAITQASSQAGKEANMWHFGVNAAVDFNSGAPVAVFGSALSSIEGTSTVCDGVTGALLFYTDGITVYNSQNNIMPNGTGLHGHSSSTQCGLIVRLPGSTHTYYVFSVDQLAGTNGIKYSLVDMTLAGGLGDVTTKNVPLMAPTSEKVTAVRHCNGIDYWILTHKFNSDTIYAFLLTSTGIGPPAKSKVGMTAGGSTTNARGEMKLSPDGSRLAVAYDWLGAELYDFDNSTGIVSNPITLTTGVQRYGVCFSPDGSKLYMTSGWQGKDIIQYDLASANIPASAVTVGTTSATYAGSLQNGPDGKMYVATYGLSTLGRINDPNALAPACNYVDIAFNVGNVVRWGLPNFPVDASVAMWGTIDSVTICAGDTAWLQASQFGSDFLWSTGDTTSSIAVSDEGLYTVEWTNSICTLTDTFYLSVVSKPIVIATATDSVICAGDSTVLTASGANSFQWVPGGSTQAISVSPAATQTYQVIGTALMGCADTGSITITVNPIPSVSITATDTVICAGDSVTLVATGAPSYDWGIAVGPMITVAPLSTQVFVVTGTDVNGCSSTDSVQITVLPLPPVNAGTDQVICEGDSTLLLASGAITYQWSTGTTKAALHIAPASTTTYSVTGTDANGCSASDQVMVVVGPLPDVDAGTDQSTCAGESVTLTARGAINYAWEPGMVMGAPISIPAVVTTVFTVTGVDVNGCKGTDTVTIDVRDCSEHDPLVIVPNAFSPNNDGVNDGFGIVYMDYFMLDALRVFNRWGEMIFETNDPTAMWDGTVGGREQPMGSYTFVVNGANEKGEAVVMSGNVALVR